MARKTFTFTKRTKSMDDNPEVMANRIVCDKYVFTMKNFKYNKYGHDDSLAYDADLLLDGEKLCHCSNDGWGGFTELIPSVGKEEELSNVCDVVKTYSFKFGNMKFDVDLDYIADILAITCFYTK